MVITERDIKIFKFINEFTFSRMTVLREIFFPVGSVDGRRRSCERRLKVLNDEKFLIRVRDFRTNEFVFRLSKRGDIALKNYIHETFWCPNHFPWATFIHDDFVQQVLLVFLKNGHKNVISEKRIRKKQIFEKFVPDFLAQIKEDKFAFFEVELHPKTCLQYQNKAYEILSSSYCDHLIYLAGDELIAKKITHSLETHLKGKLKVHSLHAFLKDPAPILDLIFQRAKN